MSRQNLSRANQLFAGRASLGNYATGKPGYQCVLMARFKPVGARAAAFTGALAAGATSGTLSGAWGGASGIYPITFSDGEVLNGIFTNGATTCPFLPASFPQEITTSGAYGGTGALENAVTATISVGNQPPVVGVANAICLSQAITAAGTGLLNGAIAASGVATPDVARNVVAAWTGAAVLTVTGTDMYGQPQTESSASGTTFAGKKAFGTITAVNVSANVTAATVGTGNVLGLPFTAESGDLALAAFNDAADAGTFVAADTTYPATATTGDVRGTYTAAGVLNGAKFLSLLFTPRDPATQVGTFGVPPV